jgi:undecaprenyl phosphate-alpha-L-ara4FN deformylase
VTRKLEPGLVGLRVDVDTYRGTREGVPRLLDLLASRNVRASFFFSVGPDNMGRHLWRLLRPAFFSKMLRSNAPGLYGWDILLKGTLWPGPHIARSLGDVIRATADAGHEVGLHAWDHHRWQSGAESMPPDELRRELQRGMEALSKIVGRPVRCSAAAGWICTHDILRVKEAFGYRYNSDCRGTSIFRPVIDGVAHTPQIPVTLPTYDEVIGRDGISDANYNARLLSLIRPGRLNVLAVHAEVEGMSRLDLFSEFLAISLARNLTWAPLGDLLPDPSHVPEGSITVAEMPGREGRLCQQTAEPSA